MEESKEEVKQAPQKDDYCEMIDGEGKPAQQQVEFTPEQEEKLRVMKDLIIKKALVQVKSLRPDRKTLIQSIQLAEESDMMSRHLSEILKCSICLGRVVEPLDCKKCDRVYCKECLLMHLDKYKNDRCPDCRQPIEVTLNFNRVIKQIYDTITYNGCSMCSKSDKMTTNQLVQHLQKECLRILNRCPSAGCRIRVSKKNWEKHLLVECKGRCFDCEKCEQSFDRNYYFSHSCQEVALINERLVAKTVEDLKKDNPSFKAFVDSQVNIILTRQQLATPPVPAPQANSAPPLEEVAELQPSVDQSALEKRLPPPKPQPAVLAGVRRKSKALAKGTLAFAKDGDNYICENHAKPMTLVEAIPLNNPDRITRSLVHIWCDVCGKSIDRIACIYSESIHLNLANLVRQAEEGEGDENDQDDNDGNDRKRVGEKRKRYPFRYRCEECPNGGMDVCLKCINDDKNYLPPQ
ncbi:hypothetical protein FGO68_gene11960 [Halteria grandinella]|uniref:RING-type domain-containing protein n=1 Tax=Halteria grandinella TaxID=5974 RepID=A0A8J8NQE3_HALGN|nr:hypothetical protein FGO68_gene11960 [Halteria grandinella]